MLSCRRSGQRWKSRLLGSAAALHDGADPQRQERVEQVQTVLAEIGAQQVPQLVVMNKADLLSPQQVDELG